MDKIGFAIIAVLVALIAGVTGVALAEYLYGDLVQRVAYILSLFR